VSVPTIPQSKPETSVDPTAKLYERIQTTCVFILLLGFLLGFLAIYATRGIVGGVLLLVSAPLLFLGTIGCKVAGFMLKHHDRTK
jgi:hypothetical protein